jgi:hypothetical protein
MKFNHPDTVLWDEMHILSRGDSPFQFPSEFTSQMPVKIQGDNHLITMLCQTAMSTCLPEEVTLLILLLLFSLD